MSHRDEAEWDAILEAVKQFKRTHGRVPKSNSGDADERKLYERKLYERKLYERKLYEWPRKCSDRTMRNWTQERANKLAYTPIHLHPHLNHPRTR